MCQTASNFILSTIIQTSADRITKYDKLSPALTGCGCDWQAPLSLLDYQCVMVQREDESFDFGILVRYHVLFFHSLPLITVVLSVL